MLSCLMLCGLSGRVVAQGASNADPAAPQASQTNTASQMLRGVVLDRRDIFEPQEEKHWPARVANDLHIMTRAAVVRRELLFATGESYDSAKIAESERN